MKEAPPCVAELGEIDVKVGNGLLTVNVFDDDVPPPGAGFTTVTLKVPAFEMSVALIVAVSLVELTKEVVRADPAQSTVDVFTKLVPVTVSVKPAPPAVALLGDSDVIVGLGLFTVKFTAFDTPPPGAGLVAVTGNVPAVATSAVLIVPVSLVELLKVVVRAEPFQFTVAPFTKPVPLTVRENEAAPSVLLLGVIEVSVGTALLIAKLRFPDVPPPGAGLLTETFAVPAVAISEALIVALT